jgi:hypothetical protein
VPRARRLLAIDISFIIASWKYSALAVDRKKQCQEQRRDASCCYRRVLAKHGGDLPPAVDPAQLNLPTDHEAEEQDQRRVFARQRALRLHATPEFFVEPFNRVRGAPEPVNKNETAGA